MLALAHHVERQIESGVVEDYASVASALGLTRARVSQVMSLLLLAPQLQADLLAGRVCTSERNLRALVSQPEWSVQQDLSDHISNPTQPSEAS